MRQASMEDERQRQRPELRIEFMQKPASTASAAVKPSRSTRCTAIPFESGQGTFTAGMTCATSRCEMGIEVSSTNPPSSSTEQ